MHHFAHINTSGEVYALSNSANNLVKIDSEDTRLLGTTYDEGTGSFVGYNITLTADKQRIDADGQDIATITANVTTWDEQPGADFAHDIIFEVDGTQIPATVENGQAVFEFASNEAGTYTIKTANDQATILSNGSIEIEVIGHVE